MPIETRIEIPDLPQNAPPSATGARLLLLKFGETLSYQLTWAEWLMERLEDCCDDIAEQYAALSEQNVPTREATVAWIATSLTDLYALTGDSTETNNDFAIRMRAAFDAN